MSSLCLTFIYTIAFLFSISALAQNEDSYRVYSPNNKPLKLKTDKGETLSLPSGTRFSKVDSKNYLVFNPNKEFYEIVQLNSSYKKQSWLPKNQDELKKTQKECLRRSDLKEVFKNEALESLNLSKSNITNGYRNIYKWYVENGKADDPFAQKYKDPEKLFKNEHPYFSNYIEKLKNELELFLKKVDNKQLKKLALQHNKLMSDQGSKKLNQYTDLISSHFNPQGKQGNFSERTLYVPVSLSWLKKQPSLYKWYEEEWINKGIPSPLGGSSGEGVSPSDDPPEENYFLQVKDKLLELKYKVFDENLKKFDRINIDDLKSISCPDEKNQTVKDQSFKHLSDEEKWLLSLDENSFKHIDRMIFIHEKTWKDQSLKNWRDFIPVDQSISCFGSNALLSTLIHESNVNSGNSSYFPSDSHGTEVDINLESAQQAILKKDQSSLKWLTGRESQLQLIYLDQILNSAKKD